MIKIYKYGEVSNEEIFARFNPTASVEGVVAEIIANVIKNGDAALKTYAEKFDGVSLSSLEVTKETIFTVIAEIDGEDIYADSLRIKLFK